MIRSRPNRCRSRISHVALTGRAWFNQAATAPVGPELVGDGIAAASPGRRSSFVLPQVRGNQLPLPDYTRDRTPPCLVPPRETNWPLHPIVGAPDERRATGSMTCRAARSPGVLAAAPEHDDKHERHHRSMHERDHRLAGDDVQPQQRKQDDDGREHGATHLRVLAQSCPR